jgi:hypothetical protein
MRTYETPTLIRCGSFYETIGRIFGGWFADGQGAYDYGPTKHSSIHMYRSK